MSAPKESVIRKMTRLAIEHNAVNLSQGITDEPVVYDLAWAGISAILGGSDEGADQLQTLTLGDLLSIHKSNIEPHLNTSLKNLLSVLQPTRDRYNQYSFPFGLPELRTAIADYTNRFYNFRPDPDTQITVTSGSTEALSSTLRAMCNPGDGLIIFQPFHEMYPNQANIFGLKPIYVTLNENPETQQWELNEDELTNAAKNARAIILNTPHNPTGKVFTEKELTFIANLCKQHNLYLITDEIYEHILYNDHIHICPATINGMAERTFVINSISKTANASGWRIGWIISPPQYTPQIRAIHDTLVVQAPTPLQKGAENLLTMPDAFYKNIHVLFQQKRDLLVDALRKIGFQITPPNGAYYLFANYRSVPKLSKMNPTDAAMYLIEKLGVACVPGDNFYQQGNNGDNYLRFSFCRHLDTLTE
ncbi:MAG: pyridoxal phosphate-dependent aminotransferase, partial [Candidatus Latescibacterota bacterium]